MPEGGAKHDRPSSVRGLVVLLLLAALCLPGALAVGRPEAEEGYYQWDFSKALASPTPDKVSPCWRLDPARIPRGDAAVVFVGPSSLAADGAATILMEGAPKSDAGGILILHRGSDEFLGYASASGLRAAPAARQPEAFRPEMCGHVSVSVRNFLLGGWPMGLASRLPAGHYEAVPITGRLADAYGHASTLEVGRRTAFEVLPATRSRSEEVTPLPACRTGDVAVGTRVVPARLPAFARTGVAKPRDSIVQLVVVHLSDRPCRVRAVARADIATSPDCFGFNCSSPRPLGQILARIDAHMPADHMKVEARWDWPAGRCRTSARLSLEVKAGDFPSTWAYVTMCPGRPRLSRLPL